MGVKRADTEELLEWIHARVRELRMMPAVDRVTAAKEAEEFCNRLQSRFGPNRYYIPSVGTAERDAAILADHAAKLKIPAIAEKHQVCVSTVEKIIARAKQAVATTPAPASHNPVVSSDDPWATT